MKLDVAKWKEMVIDFTGAEFPTYNNSNTEVERVTSSRMLRI
jgi:hypothetical protein